ncbi:MAG TPA: hypothetical protein VMR99_01180 [Candidatus Paceibacterota bacterium]|nr:hypothetical protein [Candidatus Paceibacterota bacterium]
MKKYQTVIDRALEHVREQQSPDGGFANFSSIAPDDFSGAIARRTTFFTANILTCLQAIPEQTGEIQNAAAKFLIAQKSERWSFNYWARDARERVTIPYPDDLDDTFAAMAALARHDAAIIDGHATAAIATMLTAREVREGGPYRTWLVADDAPKIWQDVDPVVNSTIGYFLSLIGVHLPKLEDFINDAVREDRLTSPYYPGMFHVGYFISRFYAGIKNSSPGSKRSQEAYAKLADIITARLIQSDGEDITVLERAMAISSLVHLGYPERILPAMADLLAARLEREGFAPYAFCIDPSRGGKRYYAGASALTAAFSAEALARYSAVASERRNNAPRTRATPGTSGIHDDIRNLAQASCQELAPDLREAAMVQIEKTSDEKITTLAHNFREALHIKGKTVPLDVADQLSLANLYGWMAYAIYDDAFDGESHTPSLIPCANFFLRTLTEIYASFDKRVAGAQSLFRNMMNRIDSANAWEQKYCHIPADAGGFLQQLPPFGDHQTLADRSIGHAMGPLAELFFAGYDETSQEYKSVEEFFRHYLIARQLHDDAHDWADDLLRGRVNSMGALVLRRFRKKYSGADGEAPAIAEIIPELQTLFWKEIIDDTAGMIDLHIKSARATKENSSILHGTDFLESELQRLESGARRAVKERNEVLVFLKDYKGTLTSGAQP